jgi:hypothetical protein
VIDDPPPVPKAKRKQKKGRRRKRLTKPKTIKKPPAQQIPSESYMVAASNTDKEHMEEVEIQPEFDWELPSRNRRSTSRKRSNPSQSDPCNPIQKQEHNQRPIRQRSTRYTQNDVRPKQDLNQQPRPVSQPRQRSEINPRLQQESSAPSVPERDGYSFGRKYQNVYSQDIRPYKQNIPVYKPQDRHLAKNTFQNNSSWSHRSFQPDNVAPQMRSYTYSYSTSMPNQNQIDMYDFDEEDRNPLSYNGSTWKRPRNSYKDQCSFYKSRAQSHHESRSQSHHKSRAQSHQESRVESYHEDPDDRWQVACQIEGHQQDYNREPFEE